MRKNNKIIIFDVCGTLTKTNNTYSFILFVCKNKISKLIQFYFFIILLDFFSLLKQDVNLIKLKIIGLLKGNSSGSLRSYSRKYIDILFKKKLVNSDLINSLRQYQKNGFKIILLSASIDAPIRELSSRLDTDYFASELIYDKHGNATGGIKNDLTFKKLSVIQNSICKNIKFSECLFFSDNFEDLAVMKEIKNSYAVFHTNKSKKFWEENLDSSHLIYFPIETSDNLSDSKIKKNDVAIYLPLFYYLMSRPLSLFSIIIKELFPLFFLTIYLLGLSKLHLILIIYFVFYCFYEIGILYNDYIAIKKETNPTIRIPHEMKINLPLFIFIRFISIIIVTYTFGLNYLLLIFGLLALFVLILHSNIKKERRSVSFMILRFIKAFIPTYILFGNQFIIPLLFLYISQHLLSTLLYYGKVLKTDIIDIYKVYFVFLGIFVIYLMAVSKIILLPLLFFLVFINYILFIEYRFSI